MRKEAKANLKYLALMLFLVVAVVAIVYAAVPVLVSTGGSTVSVDEDVGYVYNISVNNTDQGGIDNITQVNITLTSNFLANASKTNATYAMNSTIVTNFVFANTTGVLSWLINILNVTVYPSNYTMVYFVFNATATDPGNFNFSVLTVNMTTGFTNSTNISVIVNDTTTPYAVTIGNPAADGTNTTLSTLVVNVTVTDNNPSATGPNAGEAMKISLRLFNSARAIINSSNSTGLFNNQTTFTGLADGIYYVNATGNDSGDNVLVSSTFRVTIDTVYPQNISFGTQTQDDGINVTANSTYVNVTSYNDTNFVNVTFTLWNTTSVVNSTTFNSTPMTYTMNWTNLPDGNYTYAVNITDAVNQVNSTGLRKIVLDKTVPSATLRTPTAGGNYSGNLILNTTVSDATAGVSRVYFNITLGNNTESSNFTTAFISGSEWNVTINTVNYIEGEYNITVYANDTAGNSNSTVGVILFRFDNRVPNITAIRNPVSGGNYSGNLILNASIADPTAGVSNVYFNITPRNNTANHTFVKAVQSGTEWNVTIATTAYTEGVYNITVYANDTAGNTNSTVSVVQVTIDNGVPAVTLRNPASGINYSGSLILNATVSDATMGLSWVYFNITPRNNTANSSFVRAVQSGTEWNVTIATTAYSHGTYNITVSANDTLNNINRTVSAVQVIFDNVAPNVSALIRPINSGNYSGNLILNATVIADNPSGISSVFFNISNASWSVFLRAFQAGNQWNITINTSNGSFKDSKYYNVTVYVNDTAGNLNSSEKSTLITIDNTAPAITHTCTPTSTTQGNTGGIACTCTATDAIATPVVDHTASPSVVDTGTFTTRCTASDYTGNSALSDFTYTVTSSTSSGGGGGGGGSAGVSASVTKTYSITEEQAEVGYINVIKENEQVKLAITITVPATAAGAGPSSVTENHYVKVADVVNKSVTITVSSTPQTATLAEGEEKKFEVTNDTFYDISVKLNGIVDNKANLTIKSIYEEMPAGAAAGEEGAAAGEEGDTGAAEEGAGATNLTWLWIVIAVIVVVVIIIAIAAKKGGKGRR